MFDVVFITPNMRGDIAEEVMGTLQLATILKKEGINCDILQFFRIGDLSDFGKFMDNAMKMLDERKPKVISFYTRCDSYHIDLKLAEQIKKRWNDVYVVFGGPQSDITAKETVEQIPYVDFVCCGEGENTIYPFFSSLLNGEPDLSVPGLVYREAGEVKKNPRPVLMEDLDSLPLIDYSFFRFTQNDGKSDRTYFPIDVGRGCPFGCTYCSTKTFWGRKYRLKSPQRIFEEVKVVHEKFGVNRFTFAHDMFTLNRNKVVETCDLLHSVDFPIDWKCCARLDCIDKELIDIMMDAGMKRIFIGIETGSPRMQKLINKNLKLDNAVEMIAYLKSKGISTTASFIHGFPDETEEDLSQTMALIRELLKLKSVDVQTHLCTFLAGTELAERYQSVMTRAEQYSDVTGNFAVEECEDLIEAHPDLFMHMLEYKSELRTRLRYFKVFFRMWRFMQPVYQYISEKYPEERLIDMYFDFVEANEDFLKQIKNVESGTWFKDLLCQDHFVEKFSDDENYDLISDYYRLKIMERSEEVRNGGSVTDIYCFSPSERKRCLYLQDYKRCIAVVTCYTEQNGNISFKVKIGL